MARKRGFKKKRTARGAGWALPKKKRPTGTRRHSSLIPDDELIVFIYQNGGKADLKTIIKELSGAKNQRKEINGQLQDLCRQNILQLAGNKTYRLQQSEFPTATVSVNPKGFAFATLDEPLADGRDLFIGRRHLGSARHNDHVLLQIMGKRKGHGRLEAQVVTVLKRGISRIVGTYVAGRTGMVIPQDPHFPFHIIVRREQSCGARDGEAVLAEIGDIRPEQRNVTGRIVEVLGDPAIPMVQMKMVIRQFELPGEFSPEIIQDVEKISSLVELTPERRDLRDIQHVTIDGETARDFDDAVALVQHNEDFRLYVSIADVSHYVTPGSPLDQEAYQRGTSVYFPTGVLPMLPERLSNGLCSLNPNEDRYAFTAILDFDRDGVRKNEIFCKSVIKSRARLTYTMVKEILVDRKEKLRNRHEKLIAPLEMMASLGSLLEKQRLKRGSIGFEMPEAGFEIDENEHIKGIVRQERNLAHKLIEEFMLAANEAVAETLSRRRRPSLYRIHEAPDEAKVGEFANFLSSLGHHIRLDGISPKWFNTILSSTRNTPQEYIVNNLLLRSMKQARYSPNNVGHFGLAAPYYTHFTSPIRRYPDLMVHRALAALISNSKDKKPGSLVDAGDFLSKRERAATKAEWAMLDRLKVLFMADKVGESFKAVISGVTSFGLFVELSDIFVSGAISMSDLQGDYYHFDEKNYRLSGERRGLTYQLGDLIRVKLIRADRQRYRLDFMVDDRNGD